MFCSNCGHELAPDAKFCSNCGSPVTSGTSTEVPFETPEERRERERREDFARAWGAPPLPTDDDSTTVVEPVAQSDSSETHGDGFATRPSTWEVERAKLRSDDFDDEWSMSDLGPAKPQRRRTWLWVLLGTIAVLVIACCVFAGWMTFTDSGNAWIENLATQAAQDIQRATESAATPHP